MDEHGVDYLCAETIIVHGLDRDERLSDFACGKFLRVNSRQGIKKAIKKKLLLVNGEPQESAYWVKNGDSVVLLPELEGLPKVYELALEIVYEDDYLAVINKPAGLVVSGNQFRTAVNALPYNVKQSLQKDAFPRPLAVHRLDSSTSGLLLVSKTRSAHISLSKQFEQREVKKRYKAVLSGLVNDAGYVECLIDEKLSRSRFERVRFCRSIKNGFVSLVNWFPETGRTHQLRIHSASIGHPIMGDGLYGTKGMVMQRKGLYLCAVQLEFVHPVSLRLVNVEIEEPHKFGMLLQREQTMWEKSQSVCG